MCSHDNAVRNTQLLGFHLESLTQYNTLLFECTRGAFQILVLMQTKYIITQTASQVEIPPEYRQTIPTEQVNIVQFREPMNGTKT